MNCDLLIRNGRVVDPAAGVDEVRDIAVQHGLVAAIPAGEEVKARETLDARGCLVLPGLVDFHMHIGYRSTQIGVPTDVYLIPNGVTTAGDGGTTGSDGFEGFVRNVIGPSDVTVKAFMNILHQGVPHHIPVIEEMKVPEDEYGRMRYLFNRYPEHLLGVKLWSMLANRSLEDGLALAGRLGQRLCIHAASSKREMGEVLDLLRRGDIIVHIYQSRGSNFIGENGRLKKNVWEARKRGVVFETANGRMNYNLDVARAAFAEEFYPDIISSDCTFGNTALSDTTFALPYMMSLYYSLGMPFREVIRAATATPAGLMGLGDRAGSLRPGMPADIAVMQLLDTDHAMKDVFGSKPEPCKGMFVPMATVKWGRVLYRRLDFTFCREKLALAGA